MSNTLFSITWRMFGVKIFVLKSQGSFMPSYRCVNQGIDVTRPVSLRSERQIWGDAGSLSILYSPTNPASFLHTVSAYLGVMLLAKGNLTIKKKSIFTLAYTIINQMTEKQMSLIRTLRFTVQVIN